MDNSTDKPLSPKRRRSGSETRQRGRLVGIRLSPEECAPLEQGAADAGLTLASHARLILVSAPRTRARRRPPADVVALARLLGQVNVIGSNIHQLLRRVNFGETPLGDEVREALLGYKEMAAAILAAMGRDKR